MTPAAFRLEHPGVFLLDASDAAGLSAFLLERGALAAGESVRRVAKAGEGNMNCVVRVTTDRRTFIVKQARPWVEKYPQFAAPWDRALRERDFYELVAGVPAVASAMPRLLFSDAGARVLGLEDLGDGGDYTCIYRGARLEPETIDALADYASALHGVADWGRGFAEMANREMRALNHAHIFDIPLTPGAGPDLDSVAPGLQAVADVLKRDSALRERVARLGSDVYLADGPRLVHGDFFPGSFVKTPEGPRVIDPEFGFCGRAEWDVGVFLAHFRLAVQPAAAGVRFRRRYVAPDGFDDDLMRQVTGVEILRRLIGYAQLPLAAELRVRVELLECSRELILRPGASRSMV